LPVIAVINRKGGSGKSTVATHVAAHLARSGLPVMLGDVDRQQSSRSWLRRRGRLDAATAPPISSWIVDPSSVARPPSGVSHLVLDTPGGVSGFELARLVMWCDAILIPVCDSAFDRESAAACHAELGGLPRVASGRCRTAVVGMRIDRRTRGHEALQLWCAERGMHFLGSLRNTQLYVQCAERGLTLFDLPPGKTAADLQEWAPVVEWLERVCLTAGAERPLAGKPPPAAERTGAGPKGRPAVGGAAARDELPMLEARLNDVALAEASRLGMWGRLRRLLRA
jgi:chromosome partitioning protein